MKKTKKSRPSAKTSRVASGRLITTARDCRLLLRVVETRAAPKRRKGIKPWRGSPQNKAKGGRSCSNLVGREGKPAPSRRPSPEMEDAQPLPEKLVETNREKGKSWTTLQSNKGKLNLSTETEYAENPSLLKRGGEDRSKHKEEKIEKKQTEKNTLQETKGTSLPGVLRTVYPKIKGEKRGRHRPTNSSRLVSTQGGQGGESLKKKGTKGRKSTEKGGMKETERPRASYGASRRIVGHLQEMPLCCMEGGRIA